MQLEQLELEQPEQPEQPEPLASWALLWPSVAPCELMRFSPLLSCAPNRRGAVPSLPLLDVADPWRVL